MNITQAHKSIQGLPVFQSSVFVRSLHSPSCVNEVNLCDNRSKQRLSMIERMLSEHLRMILD